MDIDRYFIVRYFIVPKGKRGLSVITQQHSHQKANIEKEQKVVLIIINTAQSFLYYKIHFFVFSLFYLIEHRR